MKTLIPCPYLHIYDSPLFKPDAFLLWLISLSFSLVFCFFFSSYTSGILVTVFLKTEDSETQSSSPVLMHTSTVCLHIQIRHKLCLKKKEAEGGEWKRGLLQCIDSPRPELFQNWGWEDRGYTQTATCKHGCQQYHPKSFPYGNVCRQSNPCWSNSTWNHRRMLPTSHRTQLASTIQETKRLPEHVRENEISASDDLPGSWTTPRAEGWNYWWISPHFRDRKNVRNK